LEWIGSRGIETSPEQEDPYILPIEMAKSNDLRQILKYFEGKTPIEDEEFTNNSAKLRPDITLAVLDTVIPQAISDGTISSANYTGHIDISDNRFNDLDIISQIPIPIARFIIERMSDEDLISKFENCATYCQVYMFLILEELDKRGISYDVRGWYDKDIGST